MNPKRVRPHREKTMGDLLFYLLGFVSLIGAVAMVLAVQPIFAAIYFIIVLIALAGIFALLGSSFMFAIQIIIYAGAIVSLILFIIMFLNIQPKNLPKEPIKSRMVLLSAALVAPFSFLLIRTISHTPIPLHPLPHDFGTLKSIGASLYSSFVFPFELISLLLLVSLIGSIILTHQEKEA